jgi:hypothetical protein
LGLGGADQFLTSRPAILGKTEITSIRLHDPGIGQLAVGFQPAICDRQAQALGAKAQHAKG